MRYWWMCFPGLLLATVVVALDADPLFSIDSTVSIDEVLINTKTSVDAYQTARHDLSDKSRKIFQEGHSQFNEAWVVAPEPGGVWGLVPTFNEDRCSACHKNNGRAAAPAEIGRAHV